MESNEPEAIKNSDEFRNFVQEWTSQPDPCAMTVKCHDQLSKQISFKVTLLNENQYFNEFVCQRDISKFEQAQFNMYNMDTFVNVKNCFAINNDSGLSRVDIFSGFFVIDGKILDPFTESQPFENLNVGVDSEIILVHWLNNRSQDDDEDEWSELCF